MQSKIRFINRDASPFLVGIIILFLAAIIVIAIFFSLRNDPIHSIISDDQVISVLYVFEKDQKPLCTYVLMCYPKTKKAAIYDIPQELGMLIHQINRVDRLETLYDPDNISNYMNEINKLLKTDILFSIVINTDDLVKAVDLIEGVELFIPLKVELNDDDGLVMFSSGINHLDGDKALSYISYKSPDEDRETSIFRRQRFFISFLKRQAEMNEALRKTPVSRVYHSLMKTNLGLRSRIILFDIFAGIDFDRINIHLVGGTMRLVSEKMLLIPFYDGSLIKDIVRQGLTTLRDTEDSSMGVRVFTVEVLNGTTVSGLAGRTAEILSGFGYDILSVGNADNFNYDRTIVIDRSGFDGAAKKFAEIIRCNNIMHESDINEEGNMEIQTLEYKSDFTLIIGRDFNVSGRYVSTN